MARGQAAEVMTPTEYRSDVLRARSVGLYIKVLIAASIGLFAFFVSTHMSVLPLRPTGTFPWASFAFLLLLAVFA